MGTMLAPIEPALAEAASFIEATLDALLPKPSGPEARLMEAMRYATLGAGRRWRAFLVLQSGRLFGVDRRGLGRVAAAVECLHAYSRVHDDLPAIGNAEVRRGKPALHKAFDEATAILAGDALHTLAFTLIASPEAYGDPFVRCELIAKLAAAAGHTGVVGGQAMQIGTGAEQPSLPEVTRLARMKTSSLLTFCCEAGAIMGKASSAARQCLASFGQELGLAYQIADNLLDADDSATRDRDEMRMHPTVVSVLGVERARAQAEALVAQAARHLDLFDEKADLLRAATRVVVIRKP